MKKEELLELVEAEKWSVQVFNGYPIFLISATYGSSWVIKEILGVAYRHLFFMFKGGRAQMHYDQKDWQTIGDAYFAQVHTVEELNTLVHMFEKESAAAYTAGTYTQLPTKFPDLVALAQRQAAVLGGACGRIAHAIEGITMVSEAKLRSILESKGAMDEITFSKLCSPTSVSFVALAQEALWEIRQSEHSAQPELTVQFLKNFGWFENTYRGSTNLTNADVLQKASQLKEKPTRSDLETLAKEKESVMQEL